MSQLLHRFLRGETSRATLIYEDDWVARDGASVVERARSIAASLSAIEPGERVAVLVHPCADFVSAFFGVLLAGGCVVVLSPIHPVPESQYFCADAGVKTVLVSEPLLAVATALEGVHVVRIASIPAATFTGTDPSMDESAPALQLYTSGTTGKPKGAILTHRNIGIQQGLVGEAWGFTERDMLLHALPLHHMHGLAIALLTAIGASAAIRLRSFDAASLWNEMERATVFMGVPAMYHRLFVAFDAATDAERARWTESARKLRLATSGSAALPVTLAERWRAITGAIPLERFGMTEIGVGITNSLANARYAGMVGLPLRTVETRIVSESREDADVGELWVRGPSVFVGYHDRAKETADAFVPSDDGGDPWFRTGDTVTRDPTLPGKPFRILGRTSVDILKSGGYKLSALEIEEVLREHDAVSEVAVVGLPDDAWGERVVACVVRRTNGDAGDLSATLRAFARERLAPYKVPKEIVVLSELPKNALGKVVKPDLVARIQRAQPSG